MLNFHCSNIFLLLTLPLFLHAQGQRITFTEEDNQFFTTRKETYQRWLDQTRLGKVLTTDFVQIVKHNTELELILNFRTCDTDTATAQWNTLKRQFATATNHALTDELYAKFIYFMEIPPEQGNVQIYIRDRSGDFIKCLHIFLWDENGSTQTEEVFNECKAKAFDVTITATPIKQIVKGKTTTINRTYSTTEIYDAILRYAKGRYLRTDITDRRPEIVGEKRTGVRYFFVVEDLCKEVLKDAEKGLWCQLVEALGGECNDVTRERLEFSFDYDHVTGGLHCDVTGKFGSGVYRPRTENAWMSMEPDFEDYLERYATQLGKEIKIFLEKP